jgi:hypothetical protein
MPAVGRKSDATAEAAAAFEPGVLGASAGLQPASSETAQANASSEPERVILVMRMSSKCTKKLYASHF